MILFLLLIPMVDLFYSCCNCDVITIYKSYSHQTLSLKNLDNSGEQAMESDSLQLNKNAYGIRLYLIREEVVTAQHTQRNRSFLIPSVYAMKCECAPECVYSAKDSILSIKIVTLHKFDDQHPENSDITDYFKIAHTYSSVKNYVATLHYTYPYDILAFLDKELKIDLLLMAAPETTENQQFEVQLVLSDGRILKQQTPEIKLL